MATSVRKVFGVLYNGRLADDSPAPRRLIQTTSKTPTNAFDPPPAGSPAAAASASSSSSSSSSPAPRDEVKEEVKAKASGVKSFLSGGFGGVCSVLVGASKLYYIH